MKDKDFVIVYNTFHSVFPYVYVYLMEPNDYGQMIFIGSQKPLEIRDDDLYFFNHEDIIEEETELNTDDKPILEFSTALNLYQTESVPSITIKLKENTASSRDLG